MIGNRKHKHKAIPIYIDGIYFPSKLEGRCYSRLKILQKAGLFKFFLMQIPFNLPGKAKHKVDYCIFYDDAVRFIEAKGRDLPLGKLKRKQVEEIYDIKIHVVKDAKEIDGVVQANR